LKLRKIPYYVDPKRYNEISINLIKIKLLNKKTTLHTNVFVDQIWQSIIRNKEPSLAVIALTTDNFKTKRRKC